MLGKNLKLHASGVALAIIFGLVVYASRDSSGPSFEVAPSEKPIPRVVGVLGDVSSVGAAKHGPSVGGDAPRKEEVPLTSVGWASKYPRGIGSAASEALEGLTPSVAMQIASDLSVCATAESSLSGYRDGLQRATPSEAGTWRSMIAEGEIKQRQCQTVIGDIRSWRRKLLSLAVEGGVTRAAASYSLVLEPNEKMKSAVFDQLVKDAMGGDLHSVAVLAASRTGFEVLSRSERVVLLNALATLSTDVDRVTSETARAGYADAVRVGVARGVIPRQFLEGEDSPGGFASPERVSAALTGGWAPSNPTESASVAQLVAAVKKAEGAPR
jgi:hypothetical protein